MLLAFATCDLVHVDAQLASASHLAVYDVSGRGAVLQHVAVFGAPDEGGSRYRFQDRAAAMLGCAILYVSAIGPSAVARLARCGIRPATATAETRIHDLLVGVVAALAHRPTTPPCAREEVSP